MRLQEISCCLDTIIEPFRIKIYFGQDIFDEKALETAERKAARASADLEKCKSDVFKAANDLNFAFMAATERLRDHIRALDDLVIPRNRIKSDTGNSLFKPGG